jgi:hypothetical protein
MECLEELHTVGSIQKSYFFDGALAKALGTKMAFSGPSNLDKDVHFA